MASIWSVIKGIFGGSGSEAGSKNAVERFCFACGKMTAGTLGPEQNAQSQQPAKDFVCNECGKPTRVLE